MNSFWKPEIPADDPLAWRVFDDEYQSEHNRKWGELIAAMDDCWNKCVRQSSASEFVVLSTDPKFIEAWEKVKNAPRWKKAWWRVKFGVQDALRLCRDE